MSSEALIPFAEAAHSLQVQEGKWFFSALEVGRGGRGSDCCIGSEFWGAENNLELMVMALSPSEHTRKHRIGAGDKGKFCWVHTCGPSLVCMVHPPLPPAKGEFYVM